MTTSIFKVAYEKPYTNGFLMTFSNGLKVSVQFGSMSYCDRVAHPDGDFATSAECAVIDSNDEFVSMPGWNDDVKGWMSTDEVLQLMLEVHSIKSEQVS